MYQIVQQLASEKGVKPDDANYVFTVISELLVGRIPALKQVLEDVFANAEDDKLSERISKMIIHLEQHGKKEFETWQMPLQSIIRQQGSDLIL
jgi:hypothetical protein